MLNVVSSKEGQLHRILIEVPRLWSVQIYHWPFHNNKNICLRRSIILVQYQQRTKCFLLGVGGRDQTGCRQRRRFFLPDSSLVKTILLFKPSSGGWN